MLKTTYRNVKSAVGGCKCDRTRYGVLMDGKMSKSTKYGESLIQRVVTRAMRAEDSPLLTAGEAAAKVPGVCGVTSGGLQGW